MPQSTMTEQLVKTFIVFFLVIEPISMVPMFGALTRGGEPGYRRKMAYKSVGISALIFRDLTLINAIHQCSSSGM